MYCSYSPSASLKKAREVSVSWRAWATLASRICRRRQQRRRGSSSSSGHTCEWQRSDAEQPTRRQSSPAPPPPCCHGSRHPASPAHASRPPTPHTPAPPHIHTPTPTLGWQCPWLTAE